MKQTKLFLLLTALLSMVGAKSGAHDIEVKNGDGKTIYYNWANNQTELAVTYKGNSPTEYSNEYSGNVVIPESVTYNGKNYPVTSIGNDAFGGCSNLTSVTIPNSVTTIGSNAFSGTAWFENQPDGLVYIKNIAYKYKGAIPNNTSITIKEGTDGIAASAFMDCRGLVSVTIPNSVTTIGDYAFYGCNDLTTVHISDLDAWCNISFGTNTSNPLTFAHHLYLNGEKIKDLVIPNSVVRIGNYAFVDCNGLTSVTIPNSVAEIGEGAFYRCRNLTSITIPNSVKSIGSAAFYLCSGLTSVTIPNSVTDIGGSAFGGCSNLTSIAIPNSVKNIGSSAFYDCTGLTSVTIPNSVTKIEDRTFEGCSSLSSVTIPNSVTSIGSRAFWSCNNLSSVTIPNSVINIDDAFGDCSSLTSAIIGNGVTTISGTFYRCSKLESVTIPNSVTSIGSSAFYGCTSLKSVTFSNSLTTIGRGAFQYCIGLTSLAIPNSVTTIDENAFSGCKGLTSLTIPNSVTAIGRSAFENCEGLISVSIPNSVTSIGISAFQNCGLTSVVIPNSVTIINNSTFSGCSSLNSVSIGNSVTNIGQLAFSKCSSLKTITIPNSVTELGISAFEKCTNLESVTFGENVKIIRQNLFAGCTKISQVTSHIKEPLNLVKSVFADNVYTQAQLTVPDGTTGQYLACDGWKDFVNIKEQGQQSSFILTISGNNGGKIAYGSQVISNGSERISVSKNQSVTLTIVPDEGYEIQSVTLNGTDVTGDLYNNTYTIAQIKEDFDFTVTFAVSPLYVEIRYADGGCVKQKVEKGIAYEYKIEPADGWHIHSVTFNGRDVTSELSANNEYKTPAISESSVLNVVFEQGSSGIAVQSESPLRVLAFGNTIQVLGAETGEQIAVYSVDGKLVERVAAKHGTATISLPENQTYIVKGRTKTVKVRL